MDLDDPTTDMNQCPVPWSSLFTKTSIDDDIRQHIPEGISQEEASFLKDFAFFASGNIDADRLKNLEARLKTHKDIAKPSKAFKEQLKDIRAELKEIKSDIKFANSKRGQFTMFANDYAQEVYKELRQREHFNEVMIGSNPDKCRLVLCGSVRTPSELSELIELLKNYPAKARLQIEVIVEEW